MKQNNVFHQMKRILRAKEALKEKGVYYVFRFGIKIVLNYFSLYYYKIFKSSTTFRFQGHTYHYFYHIYNNTWRNERTIEVPIVRKIMKEYNDERILEVGNVLSHYFHVNHDILDKYEKADGVINQDVVDLQLSKKYDLIISISTIEHVGWDEEPHDFQKILLGLKNLTSLLRGMSKIVVTFLGYNTYLDKILKEDNVYFTKKYYLKRISRDNKWVEAEWDEVREAKYNTPFPSANAVVIGIIEKEV